MMAWGCIEVACLALLFRPGFAPPRAIAFFGAGVGLFGIMFAIDTFGGGQAYLRLSLEDLAKTWAGVMFMAAAWLTAEYQFAGTAHTSAPGNPGASPLPVDGPA